jgi:1D-myo-inositol 3-kinase
MLEVLVAGHYCHDTLVNAQGVHRVLGGSAAYSAAVLQALGARYQVVAKVGDDFRYAADVVAPPRVVAGARTTSFIDDYTSGARVETLEAVCEPIAPADLTAPCEVAIACPIAGELPPASIERLRQLSRVLVADVQGLIRAFGPQGQVTHVPLERTPFMEVVGHLDYLKVSADEARALDLDALCRRTRVVVTEGAGGCTLLHEGPSGLHVPAFAAEERDSTGAGDCFLAGFAVGLLRGLPVERALRLGNWCGAQAVSQVGIPRLRAEELAPLLR